MILWRIRHLARIIESDTKLKRICAKAGNSIDKKHNQYISTQGSI